MGRPCHPARKQELVAPKMSLLKPGPYRHSCRFRYFELNWPLRFPLDHHGSGKYLATMGNVAHAQADEIAAAQLAVDCQIEHGEVTDGVRVLEVDSDRPDVLRLEGRLLPDELSLVPGFALVDSSRHRLLGC